jgi:hypothetical protein
MQKELDGVIGIALSMPCDAPCFPAVGVNRMHKKIKPGSTPWPTNTSTIYHGANTTVEWRTSGIGTPPKASSSA